MDTPESIPSSLTELQKSFDQASYHLNRKLVKLLIASENDLSIPTKGLDEALEAVKAVRPILARLETWLIDHSPE